VGFQSRNMDGISSPEHAGQRQAGTTSKRYRGGFWEKNNRPARGLSNGTSMNGNVQGGDRGNSRGNADSAQSRSLYTGDGGRGYNLTNGTEYTMPNLDALNIRRNNLGQRNQISERVQASQNQRTDLPFQHIQPIPVAITNANGMLPYLPNGQYPYQYPPAQYPPAPFPSPFWPYDAPPLQYNNFNFFTPSYPTYNNMQPQQPLSPPAATPPPTPSASGVFRIDLNPSTPEDTIEPYPRSITHIPGPTQDYLLNSFLLPHRLEKATPKLLILDLNGTLLFRPGKRDTMDKPCDMRKGSTRPFLRPRLPEFIAYIFRHFRVMFWSSATPANVNSMIAAITTPQQRKLVAATWARDTLGLTPAEYHQKVVTLKDLRKVFNDKKVGKGWDIGNTILLDDSVVKASYQPYNHVCVPEFMVEWTQGKDGVYTPIKKSDDDALWQVAGYLDELRYQDNVARYIRHSPFRLGDGWHGMCLGLA
jgi:hypothetical protein